MRRLFDLPQISAGDRVGAGRAPGHSDPLAGGKTVTVADQFEGGIGGVAPGEEPAKIIDRPRQDGLEFIAEQPDVLGMRSAMGSCVGQESPSAVHLE